MPQDYKKISILFFVVSGTFLLTLRAQNIHFSNICENLFIHNPAAITRIENMVIQLTYRNQWPGSSSFNTYNGAFLYHNEPLKSTAGILILRDMQGNAIINQTTFGILYGYQARITRLWFLAGGIYASYNIYTTNFSNLTFENGQLPTIALNENQQFFDFSAGLELSYKNISRYGISLSRLGSFQPVYQQFSGLQVNLSYKGRYLLSEGYQNVTKIIEPSFYAALQRNSSELLYGSRIDIGGLLGGIYMRQNLKFEFDALILLLGIRFGNLSFFYSYDINLSGANSRFTNLAAHEVTFLYDMQYKRKRKKKGAIKCPSI